MRNIKMPKDEYELRAMFKEVVKQAATETLLQLGLIKPMITKAEAYRIVSRRRIDKAIKEGNLKFTNKGVNTMIKREDLEKWMTKHEWL
jgi:stalled ribosome rescue protein Dom34